MSYIGTKMINAEPMTRAAYNEFREWTLPDGENGNDAGYLVEYMDGGKPNVPGRAGYVSWSPAEQFEAAYRPCDAMTFGLAIEAMRKGYKVARAGWNGKGMWLILVPGTNPAYIKEETPYHRALASESQVGRQSNDNDIVTEILPHIDMWTTNAAGRRAMLPGWVASQSDMLAEDWQIVP